MIKKLFTRKMFALFVMLFMVGALVFPRKTYAIDTCQVKVLSCKNTADTNYANCMASPAGTYVFCSAWWYYDMSDCNHC